MRIRPHHIRTIIVATSATQAIMSFAAMTLASIAPKVSGAIGVDVSWIGYQVALTFGSGILTALVAGRVIGRYGACRSSQIGLAFTTLGCLLTATGHLAAIVTASIVIGLAYGFSNPSASHLINRFSESANRNLLFSVKQAGVPLGGVLAGLVAPQLAEALGWRAVPLFVAAATVLLAAALQIRRNVWDDDRVKFSGARFAPFEPLVRIWNHPSIRWLTIGGALYVMVMLNVTGFLVTILVEEYGFSLIAAGTVLSLVQATAVVARLVWGWVADRCADGLGVLFWIGVLMSVAATVMSLGGAALPGWSMVALFLLFGVSAMGWVGVFYGSLANLSPSGTVGLITGGALSVFYLGIIVGPSVIAAVYSVLGSYTASFSLVALIAIAGTVSLYAARRAEQTDRAVQQS